MQSMRWPGGVRLRSAVTAALVVGVAVAVAAVIFTASVRSTLTRNAESAAKQRADSVAVALRADDELDDGLQPGVPGAVQVLSGSGTVVASSSSALDQVPLTSLRPVAGQQMWEDRVIGGASFRILVRGVATERGLRIVAVSQSMKPVAESTEALARALLWGTPALVVVIGVAVFLLVGRTLRPVEAIRRRVATISGQDLRSRVPVPRTGDEIAALAETMNAMLDRLATAADTQRRFVADASHELRSPLTTVQIGLDHLARASGPGQPQLDRLRAEVERLGGLLSDLLLLARLDERELAETRGDVDLDDLAYSERDRLRARHPGLVIETHIQPAQVPGDASRIERALRNLGDNAARHAKSRVTLTTWADDAGGHLVVTDDGPGIPPADRGRVFERFVRLDESRAREDGGAGLGLPITREIVAGHRGEITVSDAAEFHIRLPLRVQPPSAAIR
ncbi:HAMP domain-containing histidine kinase [Actinoplanes bogorensis]|uniref:histidine kinase n=1 Tax=Paractinoplanes bogorensis TaxID=1610840 RepID=A0ABS5YX36_9ACTN|nr:HAMP domain-containing sensor histidine kinase [Actinoplanes bogorensis]MBU2668004.1 HAMP domain-containing histidine kinase [Actinoplanes bogorensis]